MPSHADTEHLLRRTEFVARPERVNLLAPKSLADAVNDVLTPPPGPVPTAPVTAPDDWTRQEDYIYFWFDRMAHDSPKPLQEKIAFFWHGHFVSSYAKVNKYEPMRAQTDWFRIGGLAGLRQLATVMSIQPAMLRYLDNDQNFKGSPNQNFARELMELFLLGVGNYTEADVEASARAWTGHSTILETGQYWWRPDQHDGAPKTFLGRQINNGGDPTQHGAETINVILGPDAVVPIGPNAGRKTRVVAAEFISRKLWTFFAGTTPSTTVVNALRDAAIANDFSITEWVRALLLRPEFYSAEVKRGLVRAPVDLMVAYQYHTGRRAKGVLPLWWMQGMGQRPWFANDVSGWRHNAAFVNAGAMGYRALAARFFMWNCMLGLWAGDGMLHLGAGPISRAQMEAMAGTPDQFVDLLLQQMRFTPTARSRQVMYDFARSTPWSHWPNLVTIALMLPEMHLA